MNKKIFYQGISDVLPMLIPVVPFGLIYGVLGLELGFDPFVIIASSFIIFGGASQLAFIQLYSIGASPFIALSSVAAVNSRHLLYGAVFSQYFNFLPLRWKLLLSYLLTDQAFAVSLPFVQKNKDFKYHLLGSGITLWLIWQVSTISGVFLGNFIPKELGLAFAIPITFLSLLVKELKKIDHLIVMIVSGVSSILLYHFPFKIYIVASALIALVVAYFLIKNFKRLTV
jgi:predicted branched-subunit amino acid permease